MNVRATEIVTAFLEALEFKDFDYAVKGNTIAFIRAEQVSGGGISGILQQLGIDIPIAQ